MDGFADAERAGALAPAAGGAAAGAVGVFGVVGGGGADVWNGVGNPTVLVPAGQGGGRRGGGRRRRVRLEGADTRQTQATTRSPENWAPKWRRILTKEGQPPDDYTEFDRTVRGMLNRLSTENASWILPLEPSLRGAEWWATRFAAMMLTNYLKVIHTNRGARGLDMGSADNVLPEYMNAVGPLLEKEPRIVDALMGWFARILKWRELCWPVTRLMILASREDDGRVSLPAHSLGRLPAELVRGRILSFLTPPELTHACAVQACDQGGLAALSEDWSRDDGQKDVVAVLAHLLMFSPAQTWPCLSSFGLSLAEDALTGYGGGKERHVFLAASILATVSKRILQLPKKRTWHKERDLNTLARLTAHLCFATSLSLPEGNSTLPALEATCCRPPPMLSSFVIARVEASLEYAARVLEHLQAP